MSKTKNIPLKKYREFLKHVGCTHIKTTGGHEKWTRKDLLRPIIVQTHIDPVPEFILLNGLRGLNITKKEFLKILEEL